MNNVAFDNYRDAAARKLMINYICNYRFVDERAALGLLRELNHIGLAHVYSDALEAQFKPTLIEYDPCRIG